MSLQPIPKELLIHTVTYEEFTGMGTWGETFAAPVTLTNVLVQPSTELIKDTIREAINGRALMFFDVENSAPLVNFAEKSKVSQGTVIYTIDKVKIFYGFDSTPHHYEIILI